MLKDGKLYNKKNKTATSVDFYKDQVIVTAKILSHKDGVYELEVDGYKGKVTLTDAEVDHVVPIESETDEENFDFFLVTDMNKLVSVWQAHFKEKYKVDPSKLCRTVQSDYDISSLTDQLYEHGKQGLKDFSETGVANMPCYPLAYIVVMELLYKMCGGFITVLVGTSPMADVMVLLWLHGYLTSSAIRKQNVKTKTRVEPISDEVIAEKEADLKKMMEKVSDTLKDVLEKGIEEDGDHDHDEE